MAVRNIVTVTFEIQVMLSFVIALFACIPAGDACPTKLKFGGPLSNSGAFKVSGRACRQGAEFWAKKVNAAGGLEYPGCGKIPVETVFVDDTSSKTVATEIMQKMIDETQIDYILGPYSTGLTLVTSEISEKASMIMMTQGASSEEVYSRGYKYIFGIKTLAGDYFSSALEILKEQGAKSVVIVHDSKTFSNAACRGAESKANSLNYMVMRKDEYPSGDLDFGPIVKQWQELSAVPDVVVGCGHFDDSILILATSKTLDFNPKAFVLSEASQDKFVQGLGSRTTEGVMAPTQWASSMTYEDPLFGTTAQYATEYETEFGEQPTGNSAGMTAAAYALGLAISASTDGSQDAVRTALLELDAPCFYAQLKFGDNGVIDEKNKYMPTTQIQNGTLQVIAPASHATATVEFPKKVFPNLYADLKKDPDLAKTTAVTELSQVIETWTKKSRDIVQEDYQVIFNSDEGLDACKYVPSCPFPEKYPLSSHPPWTSPISYEAVGVRVPTKANLEEKSFKQALCLAGEHAPVVTNMRENWKNVGGPMTNVGSQYYGDQQTGITPVYPSRNYCKDYDPRFRPWYAAAVSGPKDMVLIIDMSRSMVQHERMDAAKLAISKVLKTLIWADYAAIIAFSDKVKSYGDGLLYEVNDENREAMDKWMQDIRPSGKTDYGIAFEAAFKAITESEKVKRSSRCNRLFLFMSDGDITVGLKGSDLLTNLQGLNQEFDAKIFTYQFGDGIQKDMLKRIACQHEGIWWEIPDGGDLAGTMAAYYEYFAATVTVDRVKWTHYKQTHGKMGIAACLPAYDVMTSPKDLFGVTCVDMNMLQAIEQLMERPDWPIFQNKMKADTLKCPFIDLASTDIQMLRKRASKPSAGKSAVCSVCEIKETGSCNSGTGTSDGGGSGASNTAGTATEDSSVDSAMRYQPLDALIPAVLVYLWWGGYRGQLC